MSGALKKSTGLVGLAVEAHPRDKLRVLYTKILGILQTVPKEAAYRQSTEQIVNDKLNVVKSEPNTEKLEMKINCGQIEEAIRQAEAELSLARKMVEWKPWEPLKEDAPPGQWKWP
ncbi:NADH dehydrogenase [ubiquinone] 1 alpha subcomplex subunit 5-like [Acanthaster planci]|uniref:NADH dehydrogenase [ubiquinone] 1 alpha subcomplex subunit 5-like n=1 Tax=Acanthaster planci TaxID=133434 RepID=A0A8B7YZM0_ACAPL|nr:NADH dehydrogenase [ubiquinone] 1 alpha subcomplex subunit 5-like [Acanthaster planci]